jgi:hypothetical protein
MARGWLRLPLGLLAAAGLGLAAPASAPPSAPAWSADPESQYLLDLQIRQRALGDGVRAYPVPEGTCVILATSSPPSTCRSASIWPLAGPKAGPSRKPTAC